MLGLGTPLPTVRTYCIRRDPHTTVQVLSCSSWGLLPSCVRAETSRESKQFRTPQIGLLSVVAVSLLSATSLQSSHAPLAWAVFSKDESVQYATCPYHMVDAFLPPILTVLRTYLAHSADATASARTSTPYAALRPSCSHRSPKTCRQSTPPRCSPLETWRETVSPVP